MHACKRAGPHGVLWQATQLTGKAQLTAHDDGVLLGVCIDAHSGCRSLAIRAGVGDLGLWWKQGEAEGWKQGMSARGEACK